MRRPAPLAAVVTVFLTAVLGPVSLAAQDDPRPVEIDDQFRLASVGRPVVSPDGRWVADTVSTTDLDEETSETRLWMVSAEGSEPLPMTTPGTSASQPAWSPDGRWLTFMASRDEERAQVWGLDRRGGEGQPLTDVENGVSYYRWSPDGTRLALVVRDPDRSPTWSADGRTLAYVTVIRPDLIWYATNHLAVIGADGSGARGSDLTPEDGVEVEGLVTFPPDFEEGRRYPLLLRPHGGPVSQYSRSFNFEARLFAANGYLVLTPNPRGSSGYGQDFSAALWANWGDPDFADVMAGVDHVIEQGWADAEHLGVGGWSYVGILTNYVITQTDRFRGAITGASEVLYIANYGHDHYQRQWEAELGLPWEGDNRDVWERLSPFNRVDEITTPTLVMGGERDWNVPILNSEQLYQALRRRGVPTQLVVYPGQPHGLRPVSYRRDRHRRYLDWYARWVLGESERPPTS
jgi:dipeptidyl aminopeptidase/acylaminoacyl peptidase